MTSPLTLLENHGPMLSSSLISMMEKDGISRNTSSQRISRLGPIVKKIEKVFDKNQKFLFLSSSYKTPEFKESLIAALEEAASNHFSIINALKFHNGILPKSQLASYTQNPTSPIKSRKTHDQIIANLIKWELVIDTTENYILYSEEDNDIFSSSKAIDLSKNQILQHFNDLARNISLISYDKSTFHSEFSKLQWCFVAPSYIFPFQEKKDEKLKGGFLIADILIGNKICMNDIDFFIRKIAIIKSQKLRPVVPFLIIDSYIEPKAQEILKKHGVVISHIRDLFGEKYAAMIKDLIEVISNASAILKKSPEKFEHLISSLKKFNEGKVNNLRGDLFELLVGYYYSNGCQTIYVGKKIKINEKQKELDVYVTYEDRIVIAECKGYRKNTVTLDEATKWITETIPTIYSYLKECKPPHEEDKNIIFEFWSINGFEDDASRYLENASQRTRKYIISIYNKDAIISKFQNKKDKKFTDTLHQYFFDNV